MNDAPAGARERLSLVPMPERIAALTRDARGYPVPKFVHWVNGVPDFRVMDPKHLARCVSRHRCWICGGLLGRYQTFVIGPMCTVNRISSEPPSHKECAAYAAQACPFLALPEMRRIDHKMPEGVAVSGVMLEHNPGVTCLWTCVNYKAFRPAPEGVLFKIGDPTSVEWWAHGRQATRPEVEAAFARGMPFLETLAQQEGPAAVKDLKNGYRRALVYLPRAVLA